MIGLIFAIIFAMLLGVASIFTRRGLETGSYFLLLVLSLAIGSVVFVVLTGLTTGFATTPLMGVLYVAGGAVAGSVLGRSLYFLGINYLGPGKSLSITATSPLSLVVHSLDNGGSKSWVSHRKNAEDETKNPTNAAEGRESI